MAHISPPTYWSNIPEMTSLTTSGWQLSKFKEWPKMPNPTALLLYISRTVRARITKFYGCNKASLPYIGTGYDVTAYFRSEATAKRQSKMPLQTASGGISREKFKRGSPNFTQLSGITGPTHVLDSTTLVASGRLPNGQMQLNTGQK